MVKTTMAIMAMTAIESARPSVARSWFNLSVIVISGGGVWAGHYTKIHNYPKRITHR
jgi:hypothetical protein